MSWFSKLRTELASFQRSEKLFCLFILFVSFFIAAEYGITRPSSNALCITYFSAKIFPWLWLATVPLNLSVVALYSRFLPKIGPLKMMGILASVTVLINGMAGSITNLFPGFILFQFIWKDIYILFMFKQLWSLIHSTIAPARAKYLYGIFYLMGTLGSIAGGIFPSFFAVEFGSQHFFYMTLPAYLLMFHFYRKAYQNSPVSEKNFFAAAPQQSREGFKLVLQSPLLLAVLAIVVLMQASIGLMEYRFNLSLEQNITNLDLRTEYVGRIISITNILSGLFQLLGSFLLIQTLGVKRSHLMVPIMLLINAATLVALPSFAMISFSLMFIKAVDFSFFGVIREMLYIPMKTDEKFRAKAVIDIFALRTSKALVSLAILALQVFAGMELIAWINYTMLALLCVWLFVVWFLLRKHYPSRITV